ncbi:GT2 family glycosyltransferase [Catenuloplanes nepalensis]|uniref:GT2 family glycosyltransferase n=1 Tax=Catenuloplanes nepalensis TaxID=587533 RepID=A0ABT9N7J2_9ACTN|nr:glycosyltransferase [Catenuloplanes nepalensis]MDP9799670.1 GT2 family glycosyltransferase [Catenuloplanes nepalensis]
MTVVVASRNRREQLLRYLPRHEAPVILVDNGSEDGTADAVSEALPHVHVVRSATNLGAAGRNAGVELAETPYVAFADDDSYWESGSLGKAAALLDTHPRAALLTGQVLVGADGRGDPISAAMEAAPLGTPTDLPGPEVLGFLACAAVVRRDAFLAAGGFNPTLHVYGEEALLAMDLAAAGWGLAYVPALTVRHLPLPAGRDVESRRRRQARNDLLTSWLRRPLPVAASAARSAWRAGGAARAGLADAVRLLPWVLRHRRPLPAHVEAAVRMLAAADPGRA